MEGKRVVRFEVGFSTLRLAMHGIERLVRMRAGHLAPERLGVKLVIEIPHESGLRKHKDMALIMLQRELKKFKVE